MSEVIIIFPWRSEYWGKIYHFFFLHLDIYICERESRIRKKDCFGNF